MDCCSNFRNVRPTRFKQFFRSFCKCFAPGVVLLLIPKCPLCIVAYVAVTGVGLSFSTARNLRLGLIAVSVAAMMSLVLRACFEGRRQINKLS